MEKEKWDFDVWCFKFVELFVFGTFLIIAIMLLFALLSSPALAFETPGVDWKDRALKAEFAVSRLEAMLQNCQEQASMLNDHMSAKFDQRVTESSKDQLDAYKQYLSDKRKAEDAKKALVPPPKAEPDNPPGADPVPDTVTEGGE